MTLIFYTIYLRQYKQQIGLKWGPSTKMLISNRRYFILLFLNIHKVLYPCEFWDDARPVLGFQSSNKNVQNI